MQARTDVSFKVGDKAVYPAQGVAEVISIEEKDIAGSASASTCSASSTPTARSWCP